MVAFTQSSFLSQVRRLRSLAKVALTRFPVKVKKIQFINHGENATFKIITKNNKSFLLRIQRHDYHSLAAINEELKWLEYLSKKTELKVPIPFRSKTEKLIETVFTEAMGEERHCCMFHWIEGTFVDKSLSLNQIEQLGQLVGQLQKNSLKLKTVHRRYWTSDGLLGPNPKFGRSDNLCGVHPQDQKTITRLRKKTLKKLKSFERKFPKRRGLIHADAHFKNVLWMKNRFGVIDFDDSGYGFWAYDVCIPLMVTKYLLRDRKQLHLYPKFEAAFFQGYKKFMTWDQHDQKFLAHITLARRLTMLGWLQSRSDNPRLRAHLKVAVKKVLKDYA